MVDPKDPRIDSTGGHDPDGAPSSAPGPINPETGQHTSYWVLSEAERAEGFVRPVRRSYVHRGERPKYPTRPLTAEEQATFAGTGYVLVEEYPESERPKTKRFWTQAQLDRGCGVVTTMSQAIAETYARNPKFYGETFCCGCLGHFPVAEFVWDSDETVVGS